MSGRVPRIGLGRIVEDQIQERRNAVRKRSEIRRHYNAHRYYGENEIQVIPQDDPRVKHLSRWNQNELIRVNSFIKEKARAEIDNTTYEIPEGELEAVQNRIQFFTVGIGISDGLLKTPILLGLTGCLLLLTSIALRATGF